MFCVFTETVSEPGPRAEPDSKTQSQIKSRAADGEWMILSTCTVCVYINVLCVFVSKN